MELQGENRIAAPRDTVWAALNDPAVLARCIDGVETLTRVTADDGSERFEGKMNARVGPVRATFSGAVTVTDPEPPHRYRLVGEGKGGVAGFAKGQAEVVLVEDGDVTVLNYTVTSSVGGKLAQLGSRLIEGTAKGYAATFFERFKQEVEGPPTPVAEAGDADAGVLEGGTATAAVMQTTDDPQAIPAAAAAGGMSPLVWGGLLVAAVIALLVWQLS